MVLLTLCLSAARAEAQDTTAYTRAQSDTLFAKRAKSIWSGTSTPVLFSFSGGISLGAYQAGVNWVMLEFIKASHYPGQGSSIQRMYPAGSIPDISVTAMSGASAGNINVLLASVQYCDRRLDQPADSGLFWQMWVESGWDELFPKDGKRGDDPGALDRSRAMKRVKTSLDSTMTKVHFESCRVPLGVSVTRLRPVTMKLDRHLTYNTQRMAALFTTEEVDGHLHFVRQSPELLRARELGAQMVLPSRDEKEVSIDDVFEVVKASSSYPIAFAPVRLVYRTAGCILTPNCVVVDTAKFMDGGVFDNNPVSLAVGMGKALGSNRLFGATPDGNSRVRVLFVDPDATRDSSLLAKRVYSLDSLAKHRDSVDHNGMGALMTFAGGFVPSARQYELQAFDRNQSTLDPDHQAAIFSSTRSHPVIGEHLNAFAAFLGRPFREFDFYTGVADGMRFVATEIICRDSMPWRLDPTLSRRIASTYATSALTDAHLQAAVAECAERQTIRLADSALALSPVGRHTVQRVLKRDIPTIHVMPVSANSDSAYAQAIVLDALEDASYSKLERPIDTLPVCHSGPFLTRALCSDGFKVVLDSMRGSTEAMRVLRCEPNNPPCIGYPSVEEAASLIEDPQSTLDRNLTRALIAMRRTERAEHPDSWSRTMKLAEMIYRSADDQGDWAYDGGPSSIPRHDGVWSMFAALPYFGGPTIGVRGFQLGWQPTWHTPVASMIVELPFGDVTAPRGMNSASPIAASVFATPSIGQEYEKWYVNQVAIGARFESTGKLGDGIGMHFVSPEASAYFLGRKLRAHVYAVPGRLSESGHTRWIGGLSLADVNGIAYWILRVP